MLRSALPALALAATVGLGAQAATAATVTPDPTPTTTSPSVAPTSPGGDATPGPASTDPAPAATSAAAAPAAPVPTTTLTAAPRPDTTAHARTRQSVRLSASCDSCTPQLTWVTGVGRVKIVGMVLSARAGTPVRLLAKGPGATAYAQVAQVTTDSLGRFTWIGPMGAAGVTSYQAVTGAGVASVPVTISVTAPSLTIAAPASVDTLKDPRVTGLVTPRKAGLPVRLEVLVNGAWATSRTGVTGTGGAYSLPLTYGHGSRVGVTARVAMTLPGGRVVASPAKVVNRVAVFDPRLRAATAADVPKTYRAGCPVGPSRLRVADMNYIGFDGLVHRGRLVARDDRIQPMVNALKAGFDARFPLREMRDPSVYGGSDPISMEHDNTSAFNCRQVTGNPYRMSPHSYGYAIDVNPVENPYRIPSGIWLPANGRSYVARSPYRAGMLTSTSAITKSFAAQGFSWFSGWDWQHYERR